MGPFPELRAVPAAELNLTGGSWKTILLLKGSSNVRFHVNWRVWRGGLASCSFESFLTILQLVCQTSCRSPWRRPSQDGQKAGPEIGGNKKQQIIPKPCYIELLSRGISRSTFCLANLDAPRIALPPKNPTLDGQNNLFAPPKNQKTCLCRYLQRSHVVPVQPPSLNLIQILTTLWFTHGPKAIFG